MTASIITKPYRGMTTCRGVHTDDFGTVTALRRDGFYARYRLADGSERSVFHFDDDVVSPDTLASAIDGTRHVMLCA